MYHINVIIIWWCSLLNGNQYFYDENSMKSTKHLTGEARNIFDRNPFGCCVNRRNFFRRTQMRRKKESEQRYQKVRSGKTKKRQTFAAFFLPQRSWKFLSFPINPFFFCQCLLSFFSFYDLIKILIGFLFQLVLWFWQSYKTFLVKEKQ